MARRKTAKIRTRYVRAKKSYRKSSSSSSMNPNKVILPALVYGAVRVPIANVVSNFTKNIPLGSLADNVGMGVGMYFLAKKGKGMVKQVGLAGLIVESAQAGQELVANGFSLNAVTNNDSGSW